MQNSSCCIYRRKVQNLNKTKFLETQDINKAEVAPKTETQVQDIFINGKSTNEYTDRVEMFIKIIEWDSN